jgi:hypothetical protein
MINNVEIRCITRSSHTEFYERIISIGGVKKDGSPWKMTEVDAILDIKKGVYSFYVDRGGFPLDVIIAISPSGQEYLKTVADADQPAVLLNLPECPG